MSVALGSAYGEIRIGTGDAERNVTSLADSMRNVGTRMSLAISAPLAIIGKTGLQAAGNFEQSMNVVQVVTGATAEAMAAMQAKALQLGKDTSFSANEAAEGMLELAKAGMTAEQTIASIGGVLDLAAAGNLSVAQSAEITANALNAFQLPAEDAARVADLLAAAANSSSIEVTDMAQAFQMSSAVFASNKQSIDDLATAIAILGNNGLKGSDAGTSLKTMLMRLAAPTKEARGEMAALGVEVYNADGSMRGFDDIVKQLQTSTAGLSDAQRNAAFTTIFGADAIRAANILVDAGAESWDTMSASVNEAGAAQKVAEARMKGLNGAIDYIKGTIESTLVSAFLPLTDALGGMIRWVADLIAKFAELPQPVINAALAFVAVLAAAGPILVALPAIGAVLGALLSPIGLVVLAVAGLAAAWAGNFGGIQEKTAAVIAALQPAFDRLKQYLDMIKGGDWGGLTKAVFSDVNSMLQKAAATISAFDWSAWIAGVLQWADYITTIAWDAFIAALAWTSDIVGSVDWAGFIATLGDWSLFVGQLLWDGFLAFLKWEAFILKLEWSAFVTALAWTSDIIGKVDWPEFIEALRAWGDYIEALSWSAFVSALTWGAEYIQSLDWAGFVATLSDWGQWIASLDWTKIITTAIDWALWIPALQWNFFVKVLDFTTYVYALVWSEFISQIDWGAWISGMLAWGDHVSEFDWGEWVSGVLDWSAYIVAFTWDSFVSKLDWPVIAEFAWNEWIVDFEWPTLPTFSWGSWISSFRWPTVTWPGWSSWISSFTWPSLPTFNWGDFISSFSWPSFPSIPSDWWKFGLGGGGAGKNAMGTHFWEGGLTWVGERGPELIDLPRGARVYDATSSAQMTAGAAMTIENHYHIYNDLDVEVVTRQVMDTMRRYAR